MQFHNLWLVALLGSGVTAQVSSSSSDTSVSHNTLAGPLVIATTITTDGYYTTNVKITGLIRTSGLYTSATTYTITAGSTQTVPAGVNPNAGARPTAAPKYLLGGVAGAVFGLGALL
ncbi:hypothetical protein LTR62_000729 [Meristemomyces frigidus]|uniref:Uncharacterized protein n=1 Tax=Meristemomyces frigidus TaxID=1508187 RepID=A0AAN7YMQ6_9PEZI|nr:hypothetical protein LTR62_000729 [Meristemomyces frigidus]